MFKVDNFLIATTLVFLFNLGLAGYLIYLRRKKKNLKSSP